jgi:hypothetical protein
LHAYSILYTFRIYINLWIFIKILKNKKSKKENTVKKNNILNIAMICIFFACTRQITRQPETIASAVIQPEPGNENLNFVKKQKKDTLNYFVEFHDSTQRGNFAASLENLIKAYPVKASTDTSESYFIKAQITTTKTASAQQTITEHGKPDSYGESQKSITPVSGGSIIIYSPGLVLNQELSRLVDAYPFCGIKTIAMQPDSGSGYLSIKDSSGGKIVISISATALDADSKRISAFDLITAWSNYIKKHPAEGRALFRYVAGLDQFIGGREAIVPGFIASDEKTIILKFSQPDHYALQRLCTHRLIPPSVKAGLYHVKTEKNNILQLVPNNNYPCGRPYLNSCEIRLGKDSNPFPAFSMNRYDAIELSFINDLEYARRSVSDKADMTVISEDRYFISIAAQSPDIRKFLRRIVDKKDILDNSVKADGAVVSAIETNDNETGLDGHVRDPMQATLTSVPTTMSPLVILSCSDDPVSVIIGDKLLADISRAGLSCTLKCVPAGLYEKSLVKRDYGLAVGSAPKEVLFDASERLRIAAIWFNDETDEHVRIDSMQEIPLFSIKTYLLYKKRIGLATDGISGIFVK